MTRKNKWLVGGLAVAVLGIATVGAIARHGGDGWRHHGGGHHGWGHHRGRKGMMKHPIRMVCGRKGAERVDHMLVRIKHKVDLTEAQTPTYDEFARSVRAAAIKARESCPQKPAWRHRDRAAEANTDDKSDAKPRLRPSPIERLNNMEKMLTAGLEAIRTIRPSAEKLYASLSEEQQLKLRKTRGKRWWRRGHHRGHRGSGHGDKKPENRDDKSTTP